MIRSIHWLVIGGVIMGLGLLASCASPPTQAVSGGRYGAVPIPRPKPVDTPVRTAVAPMGGMTFVQTGESLADVAARTGNTTRELIEANGLTAPFKVQPGQQLRLPVPPLHVVQAGETASSLSRRYGVSVGDIVRRNNLAPPYQLRTGQRLILPAGGSATVPIMASPPVPPPVPPAAPIQTGPPKPAQSAPSGISVEALAPIKPAAKPPALIQQAPIQQAPIQQAPIQQAPIQQAPNLPAPSIGEPLPPPQAMEIIEPVPTPAQAPPVQMALAPRPQPALGPPAPPSGRDKFVWPVQSGEVISRYGAKPGGLHNDGVNIAAREGTPILAAGDGTVAYAGQELKGFGNLVLIRHANGWMSAYAHNDSLLVARGDQVRRGQPIARMGQTGAVDRAQLHFELRQETEAVDPLRYLPKTGNRPRLG